MKGNQSASDEQAIAILSAEKYFMNWVKGTIYTIVDWTLTFVCPTMTTFNLFDEIDVSTVIRIGGAAKDCAVCDVGRLLTVCDLVISDLAS